MAVAPPSCVITVRPGSASTCVRKAIAELGSDHGGIPGPAASEALLPAACAFQPHGRSHAALVSEQGREERPGGREEKEGLFQLGGSGVALALRSLMMSHGLVIAIW